MSPSTPPGVIKFPEDSIEKSVYKIVDSLSEFLPIVTDRNRLGFSLYKYVIGEGDEPLVTLKSAKVTIKGISIEELAGKISSQIEQIKKGNNFFNFYLISPLKNC